MRHSVELCMVISPKLPMLGRHYEESRRAVCGHQAAIKPQICRVGRDRPEVNAARSERVLAAVVRVHEADETMHHADD